MRTLLTLLAVAALAACGTHPTGFSSTTGTTPSWVPSIKADDAQIVDAMNSIVADATDVSAAEADCALASTHIAQWRSDGTSIPVVSISTPWIEAVGQLDESFTACAAGDFDTASTGMRQAQTYISETTAAVKTYGG